MHHTNPAPPLPLPSDQDATGRTLGDEEIALLTTAIRSGTLTSTKGAFVKQLETRWAEIQGAKHAHACSHGSAAIHCAVAAIDPEPGFFATANTPPLPFDAEPFLGVDYIEGYRLLAILYGAIGMLLALAFTRLSPAIEVAVANAKDLRNAVRPFRFGLLDPRA